jgi:hypothetical protein
VLGFAAIGRGALPTPVIIAAIGAGTLCSAFYLAHARRATDPIIDLSLLRVRTFAASVFGGALFYIGTTSQVFLLALLLQIGFGLTAFQAGLMLLASAAGSVVMRFTFQPILNVFGFRWLMILNAMLNGGILIACGFFTVDTAFIVIVAVLFVGGFSRSTQFTAVQSFAYAEMPPAQMSRATSFAAMAQQLMQSVGVGLTALVVHLSMVLHGRNALTPDDVALGFFTIGLLSIVSIVIFYALPARAGSELTGR